MHNLRVLGCTLCEDVRPEMAGKATLIGYIGTLPYVDLWIIDLARPVDRMSLLFLLDRGDGSFQFEPRLIAPDGRNLIPQLPSSYPVTLNPQFRTNVAIQLLGTIFPTVGEYHVQALVDGQQIYEEPLQVVRGNASNLITG